MATRDPIHKLHVEYGDHFAKKTYLPVHSQFANPGRYPIISGSPTVALTLRNWNRKDALIASGVLGIFTFMGYREAKGMHDCLYIFRNIACALHYYFNDLNSFYF